MTNFRCGRDPYAVIEVRTIPRPFVPPFLLAYESPILSIIDIDQTIARLETVDDKPKL